MKTSILLCVFVCAFTVSVSGTPKKEQTDRLNQKHPLHELYNKYHLKHLGGAITPKKATDSFRLESAEHQAVLEDNYSSYFKTDFIYEDGNRTRTNYSYRWSPESEWEIESYEFRTYSNSTSMGVRLSAIVQLYWDGEEFINEYRTLLTYQQSGNQVFLNGVIEQTWNYDDWEWENDHRTMLTAENGALTGGESSQFENNQWISYERFIFEQHGDNLHIIYQEFSGSSWFNTIRQIYQNYSATDLHNLYSEDLNILETGSFLTYAEMLPDYVEQTWNGASWADGSRQVTTNWYDIWTGQLIEKTISAQLYEEEWLTNSEVRISYEDQMAREMILFHPDFFESNELLPVLAEEFEYNSLGLVQYIIQKQTGDESNKVAASNDLQIVGRIMLQWSGTSTSIGDDFRPVTFKLGNAYPNPFNPATVIPFQIGNSAHVTIRVFDMLGRNVASLANGVYLSGNHEVRFDASGLSSGVYLIRMDTPGYQQTRRITLLK